jgi:hypothetical protein
LVSKLFWFFLFEKVDGSHLVIAIFNFIFEGLLPFGHKVEVTIFLVMLDFVFFAA